MQDKEGNFLANVSWKAPALNNARLALLATYEDAVPAFERLFRETGSDWPAFHRAVAALAALPPDERRARLAASGGEAGAAALATAPPAAAAGSGP